jgi:hypothetical protein
LGSGGGTTELLELAALDLRRGTCLVSSDALLDISALALLLSGKKGVCGVALAERKCSLLVFEVNVWLEEGPTGFRFAMLANVDAAAGMAHVWRFSGRGRGVPGGGSGWPRPIGSVCDFDIEVWSSGRAGGVSGGASISILGPSAVGGRKSVLVFL